MVERNEAIALGKDVGVSAEGQPCFNRMYELAT